MLKLAIIGDFNPAFKPHVATNEALQHSLDALQMDVKVDWIPTDTIHNDFKNILENHPFFIATLFVPQDNSSKDMPHPLINSFLNIIKNI